MHLRIQCPAHGRHCHGTEMARLTYFGNWRILRINFVAGYKNERFAEKR